MVQKIECPIKLCHPDARRPSHGSEHAAGYDLYCVAGIDGIDTKEFPAEWTLGWLRFDIQGMITLLPGESFVFRTGVKMAIQEGYVGLLWDRSGLGVVKKIHRTGGVLDSDYRGEILVGVTNLSGAPQTFEPGDKIVQIVLQERVEASFPVTIELLETDRGEGCFGSTDEDVSQPTVEELRAPMVSHPPGDVTPEGGIPVTALQDVHLEGASLVSVEDDDEFFDEELEMDNDEMEEGDLEALYDAADPPDGDVMITLVEDGEPSSSVEELPPVEEVTLPENTHLVSTTPRRIEYDGRYVSHALSNLRDNQQAAAAEWLRRDDEFFPNGPPIIQVGTLRVVPGRMAIELTVMEITREEIPSSDPSGG